MEPDAAERMINEVKQDLEAEQAKGGRAMPTYAEIKATLEAQGVKDDTVIRNIHIEENKPVTVVVNPDNPNEVEVESS